MLSSMAKKKFQWEAESGLRRDEPPAARGRTAKKRAAQAIDDLVQRLEDMKPHQRKALLTDEDVLDGMAEIDRLKAKGVVRVAIRRQRLYVAKRIRALDPEELEQLLGE